MKVREMTEAEYRLAELIWENAPIGSGELVQLCAERLGWKKSTTYTMLRKLCAMGVARNESATVTAALSREEYHSIQGETVIREGFNGSLPRFLTAFVEKRGLSREDAEELKRLIDRWEEEQHG
ncbi:MAG TPA: BlaI/MecI/CopY family transcriptional regulator [Candidatus Pygmaiobacter gallistercoris]|nr:BlaI/MecI/CopY family transcriptional regulator [Candidatus Pygmaiobacter gallistercoris]